MHSVLRSCPCRHTEYRILYEHGKRQFSCIVWFTTNDGRLEVCCERSLLLYVGKCCLVAYILEQRFDAVCTILETTRNDRLNRRMFMARAFRCPEGETEDCPKEEVDSKLQLLQSYIRHGTYSRRVLHFTRSVDCLRREDGLFGGKDRSRTSVR